MSDVVWFCIATAAIIGWISNLSAALSGAGGLSVIGLFFFPLGAVLGWL